MLVTKNNIFFVSYAYFPISFRDFDSRLYLCIEAFGFLQLDTYQRMSKYLAFPLYAVTHVTLLIILFIAVMQNWR